MEWTNEQACAVRGHHRWVVVKAEVSKHGQLVRVRMTMCADCSETKDWGEIKES